MTYKQQFEEYVSAALASVRYREFLSRGKGSGTIIAGTGKLVAVNARFGGSYHIRRRCKRARGLQYCVDGRIHKDQRL